MQLRHSTGNNTVRTEKLKGVNRSNHLKTRGGGGLYVCTELLFQACVYAALEV